MKTKELPSSTRNPSFYPGIRYHVFTTKNRICAGQWRPLTRPCHGVRQTDLFAKRAPPYLARPLRRRRGRIDRRFRRDPDRALGSLPAGRRRRVRHRRGNGRRLGHRNPSAVRLRRRPAPVRRNGPLGRRLLRNPPEPHVSTRPEEPAPAANSESGKRTQSHFRTPEPRPHSSTVTRRTPKETIESE